VAYIKGDARVDPGQFAGSHIYFGVREHGMGAIINGMVCHGGWRGFGATFLTFSDYMRGAIRLSALMHIPSLWVFTHDSIFLGEDGPTHQPIEHYAALRAIPNLLVFRPGCADETSWAWLAAVRESHRPSALLFTRQDLPVYTRDGAEFAAASGTLRGGYVLRREKGASPDLVLIATGSEVSICVDAARALEAEGVSVRVVSLPCVELFDEQPADYRESVLPRAARKRLVVEAGVSMGWHRFAGEEGEVLGMERFGASAPAKRLAEEFGFTAANVAARAKRLLGRG
jgi:transketolase